jgi:hypothetical protein
MVYYSALHSGLDSNKEFGLHTFPESVLQQLGTAPGIHWLFSFTLPLRRPSRDAPEATPSRTAIPKNLTIRLGAHRASVYGSSATVKTAPFAAEAKDPARESHARDFIHKLVQHTIMDEEFLDYQKLLDGIAVDPIPITLACIPSREVAPSSSGQKCS